MDTTDKVLVELNVLAGGKETAEGDMMPLRKFKITIELIDINSKNVLSELRLKLFDWGRSFLHYHAKVTMEEI